MKKHGKKLLAVLLAFSMVATPVSPVQVYAAEENAVVAEAQAGKAAETAAEPEKTEAVKEPVSQEKSEEQKPEAAEPEKEDVKKPEAAEPEKEDVKEPGTAEPEKSTEAVETEEEKAADNVENAEEGEGTETEATDSLDNETGGAAQEADGEIALFSAFSDEIVPASTEQGESAEDEEIPSAPTAAVSGVSVVKWDADSQSHMSYGMFPVTATSINVEGDVIKISFNTGDKKIFDRLYMGYQSDENKTADFTGTVANGTYTFTVTVPVSKRNSWIPISVGRSDKGTWSENYLWMSIPKVPVFTKQPEAASASEGENVTLSVEADGDGLTYQWQVCTDGGTWTDCEGDSARTAKFGFTMTSDAAGQYRCAVTDENGVLNVSGTAAVSMAETEEAPEDDGFSEKDAVTAVYGEGHQKEGQAYTMFTIGKSTAVVKGSRIEVTIWVNPASSGSFTYDAIYIGSKDDGTKEPVIYGETDGENGLQKYTFTVPYSAKGTSISFVPRYNINNGKNTAGTWSTSSPLALTIPSEFTMSPDEGKEAANGVAAVYGEGHQKEGQAYTMFTIGKSTAVVKGSRIEVTIWVNPASSGSFTYDAIYIGSKDDGTKEPVIYGETDEENGLQKYTFTVPYSAKGTSISFVPRYNINNGKNTAGTWSTSSPLALTIPSEFAAPTADMVEITTQPAAETIMMAGGTVTLSVVAEGDGLTYNWQFSTDGIAWEDCAADSAKTAELVFTMTPDAAGQYRCVVTEASGAETVSDTAVVREPVTPTVTGSNVKIVKEDGKEFGMFTVSESSVTADGSGLNITIETKNVSFNQIYLGSKDAGDKTSAIKGTELDTGGYSFTFTVDASMADSVTPVSLGKPDGSWYSNQYLWIYIPAVEETVLPSATDEISAFTGGTGAAYRDFTIASSEAVLKDNAVVINLNVKGSSWTRLYLGVQADTAKTPVYSGVYDEETDTTAFTFTVPAEYQGMNIAVTPGTATGWFSYARDLFINIPRLENVENTSENGIYNLYGSAFPQGSYASLCFERGSTLTIQGDTATITLITQTSSTSGYDKIYIGSVNDDDAEKDAGAAYAVPRTDIGDAYKSFTFTIPVADIGKEIEYVVHIISSNSWAVKSSSFYINGVLEKTGDVDDPDDPTPDDPDNPDDPDDPDEPAPGTTLADGIYNAPTTTSSASMFVIVNTKITSKNGVMTAEIALSGTSYDYLYMGTAKEAETANKSQWITYTEKTVWDNRDGANASRYVYEIPVSALDEEIAIAAHSKNKDLWYDRNIIIKSEGIEKISELPTDSSATLADGIYNAPTTTSNASMFVIVNTKITSKNGVMTAEIALSGTGYDYLYMGTAKEAETANKSQWITYTEKTVWDNRVGANASRYVFEIPVEELDTPICVAAHGSKWYDRTITISSDGITKISNLPEEGNPSNPGTNPEQGGNTKPGNTNTDNTTNVNDGKAENESKYETDTSGSTSKVNSSTTLADGVYTPDSFSWSGGTGKVNITCNKVTVKDGQAYATIAFSSTSYTYVKANGRKYYATISGGQSIFTIPVALNKNNKIIGLTTKMSAAHEITYTIYVYLKAADEAGANTSGTTIGTGNSDNSKLDEKAPEIIGLTYDSETTLDYAKYFKLFHYKEGATLLEVDMVGGTARDPELQTEEEVQADEAAADETAVDETAADEAADEAAATESESAAVDAEAGETGKTAEEFTAELYKENVVKYLLLPEDVEIPAGLEKEVIIINLPADKSYVASKEALETMNSLELLKFITSIGYEEEDCPFDELKVALEEEELTFAGTFDEPEYSALVLGENNLAIMSSEILVWTQEQQEELFGKTDADILTEEEQLERLADISERLALLEIPMLVDRSADEETELAKYEWIKVYGAIFGCEEQTDALFEQAVKEAEK